MKQFLDPADRAQLKQIVDSPRGVNLRPAQILLLIDEGFSIRQVAAQLGMSRGSISYWIRRYRNKKSDIPGLRPSQPEQPLEAQFGIAEPGSLQNSAQQWEELNSKKVAPHVSLSSLTEPEQTAAPISAMRAEERWTISPEDSIAEAGRKTLRYHYEQMLKNEPGTISGEDIEALHDMRVATRRMRAAFDVFGFAFRRRTIKPILKGLRKTGRVLGRVRDLDVFIEKARRYMEKLPPTDQRGMEPLLQVWLDQRQRDRKIMLTYLESSAYLQFKQNFEEFLKVGEAGAADLFDAPRLDQGDHVRSSNPVRQVAPVLVYQCLAAVSHYEGIVPHATIPELHALRIEFKRLRYTLEFFQDVLGSEAKWVIGQLKRIQDHLGDLHDAQVAVELLGELLKSWEDRHSHLAFNLRPDPKSIANYLAYRIEERRQLLFSFPTLWQQFNHKEFRQKLALAISAL